MTRKRFWVVGLAMVIITFLAAACSGAASSSGAPSAAPNTESSTATDSPTPTDSPIDSDVGAVQRDAPAKIVAPDPNLRDELNRSRLSTRGWKTDLSRHTVPFDEIISGGVQRDGIPAIDNPKFIAQEEAVGWLSDEEPIIAFELAGDGRAYPLKILTQHEIVNDAVGGVPVAVTFCPLNNTAIVSGRTLEGLLHDFGVSGNLRKSDLRMYDRQTQTW